MTTDQLKHYTILVTLIVIGYLLMPDGPWYRCIAGASIFLIAGQYAFRHGL